MTPSSLGENPARNAGSRHKQLILPGWQVVWEILPDRRSAQNRRECTDQLGNSCRGESADFAELFSRATLSSARWLQQVICIVRMHEVLALALHMHEPLGFPVRQCSRIVTVITTLRTEATTSADCSVNWGALEAGNLSTAQQAYARAA
jgi:hypothetical protein